MIIPVVGATLKSFLRSRRTLLILFVLPVILIFFIFLSFNPQGLQPVPAGITIHSGIEASDADQLFNWLILAHYTDLDDCLEEIRTGSVYTCMNVYGNEQVTFELFFDNTREPVIWEIVTRVEQTLRSVEKARTSEAASVLFESLESVDNYLGSIADASDEQKERIGSYQAEVDSLRGELSTSRHELSNMIAEMDEDAVQARRESREMRTEHRRNVDEIRANLNELEYQIALIGSMNVSVDQAQSRIDEAKQDLDDYDRRMTGRLNALDARIDQYALRSNQGSQMVSKMAEQEHQLSAFRLELGSFSSDLESMARSAQDVSGSLDAVIEEGSASLIESVRLTNIPSYVPSIETPEDYEHVDGLSVLTLQTLFPALLMLVVLFFGILLSTFMMITHITTPAHTRLRLVEGSWYKDYFAMIIATTLISTLMIALVLVLGIHLFHIPLENMASFAGLLLMILIVLSLIGIFVVHIVWSESMSVIVAMFALVATLFSSGFILPVERMSAWAAMISDINPVSIGLNAFDRVIFYNGSVPGGDWIVLGSWALLLIIGTLIVRLVREL